MQVRVQYSAQLRAAVGCSEDELELPEGSNLAEVLEYVALQLRREAAPYLLTSRGDVQPSLLIAVNHGAVPPEAVRGLRIRTGDVVMLMPPIGGG